MLKFSKKIFIALVISLSLFSTGAFAQPEGGDAVHANLESISLVEFIKFVGRYTGRNIVFNAGAFPSTNVSIYAGQSLTEPELMAVFQQVLSGSGFYAVTRDNVTYVLPLRDAQKITPAIKSSSFNGSGEEIITSVFQLGGEMSPLKVAEMLTPFASQIGKVSAIPMADAVLVKDFQANINKMRKLLGIVRKIGATPDAAIIDLTKTNSKSIATKLNTFYKKLSAVGKSGNPPVIESIEWANSLLVAGSDEQLVTIRRLISKLDKVTESYSKLKVYKLHNIEAVVAGDVLKSLVSGGISTSGNSKGATGGAAKATTSVASSGSSGGVQVSADATTNTLIVMADADQIPQIDRFVDQLDQAQDQVYIEALVLETSLDNAKAFGVEWQGAVKVGGGVSSFGYTKPTKSNLPSYAANPSSMPGGFSMGILGDLISYGGKSYPSIGALVNFTKSAGDFNLISAPQIMTIDNSEAEIFVGENRPYKTGESTSSAGDSVVATYDYRDVGIKLRIKPHINRKDGVIKLEVYQTYNTVSDATTTALPITNDRVTKTTVLLADGSIMVIGGLIKSEQTRGQSGVPYLSDLPLLGWMFKTQSNSGTKNTLMVFLSARIIKTTEQLEALSQAKMDKYRTQRTRFNSFIEKEFNTYKKDDVKKKTQELSSTQPEGE